MPKVDKVLYATDLSEGAKYALSWAISLAEKYDATISVINIIPDLIEEMSVSMGYDLATNFDFEQLAQLNVEGENTARDSIKEKIKSVCEEMKEDFPGCRTDFNEIIVRTGHPVQEIVDAATDGNYDVVVMGTHGHGLIDRILLGSVARGVVQKSPIPVLTVRLPAE